MLLQMINVKDLGDHQVITLNRPQRRNAINDQMIYELTVAFSEAAANTNIRAIVLRGAGKSFCAGADVAWMKKMATFTHEQNKADAGSLAQLLETICQCPIPVIGLAQGHVYGGAVGILACCDSVITAKDTLYCLSEVKIGLIPATIFPYLIRKINVGIINHLAITATTFKGDKACTIGLAHIATAEEDLDAEGEKLVAQIKQNSPAACRAAKNLLFTLKPVSQEMRHITSEKLAEIRVSGEGQEGLAAFLEKRQPNWITREPA